jgi:hypothetical protein
LRHCGGCGTPAQVDAVVDVVRDLMSAAAAEILSQRLRDGQAVIRMRAKLDEARAAKADAWWPYCSRWWIVAPPGIVQDGELPDGWGLMEPQARGRRFAIRTQAAAKEPRLTVSLVAELLRQADNERLRAVQNLAAKHRDDLCRQAETIRAAQDRTALDPSMRKRIELLDRLEAEIGMKLDEFGWRPGLLSPPELAAALPVVKDHVDAQRLQRHIERLQTDLRRTCNQTLAQLGAK